MAPKNEKKARLSRLKELWRAIKDGVWDSDQWLFGLTALWTVFLLLVCGFSFFNPEYLIPYAMIAIYYALLLLYTGNKEIRGWTSSVGDAKIRPGEFFVAIWALAALTMLLIQFFTKNRFIMPEDMPDILVGVAGFFFARIGSKEYRKYRQSKKQKSGGK